MSTDAPPGMRPSTAWREPSAWRLVNLALGISAVLGFAATITSSGLLVPSRWLLTTLFWPSVVKSAPTASVLLARLGFDVWLPAALVMLVFLFKGLHRRRAAATPWWTGPTLTLAWIARVATFMPASALGENAGLMIFVVGMFLVPVALALAFGALSAAQKELSAISKDPASQAPGAPALLAWTLVPAIVGVLPLLAAPGHPLAASSRQRDAFEVACRGAGVRLLDKPSAPVRSIAYERDAKSREAHPDVVRIETDASGRIQLYGGFGSPRSDEFSKRLVLDFTERRHDPTHEGAAPIHPDAPFYRFPVGPKPYFGVDALAADALASLTAEAIDGSAQMVRYQLTLSDRRSGAVLGVQTYVVDRQDGRACGVNVDSAISQDAFIYDAIHR